MENIKHFRCDCSTPYHFIDIDHDDDCVYISVVTSSPDYFWERLKSAVKFVFRQTDSLVLGDVVFTQKQMQEFSSEISKIVEKYK